MREHSDRASFIHHFTVTGLRKEPHIRPNVFSSFWKNLRSVLIAKLLRTNDSILLAAETSTKPWEVLYALEYMHREKLITWYGEVEKFNDYPKFHYFGAHYQRGSTEQHRDIDNAWGFASLVEGPEAAMIRTFGECLERHASYYAPQKKQVTYPRTTVGDASFLYPLIPHTSPTQQKKNPFLVSTPNDMRHMCGFFAESLTGDRKRFLPASAFYWGAPHSTEDKVFQDATTSGSGGGFSLEAATLSALYELIERDHFLLYWLSGTKPAQIDTRGIDGDLEAFIEKSRNRYGLEVYFFDLAYDLDVLTAACIVVDPKLNMITMGAKTGTSARSVLEGAFLEALGVLTVTRARSATLVETDRDALLMSKKEGGNVGRLERVNMYMTQSGIAMVKKAFIGTEHIPFPAFKARERAWESKEQELHDLLRMFKELVHHNGPGYHVYRHAFSSSMLDHFDYHVVHCFIPSFLKLYLNEIFCPNTSLRLTEFVRTKQPTHMAPPLNPLPHFFP